MDEVVAKITALGIPGIILAIAVAANGWVGAAALTTALAALGGPLGMLGGVALLALMVLISEAIAKFGFEKILEAAINAEIKKGYGSGKSYPDVVAEIEGGINKMLITQAMKAKLIYKLDDATIKHYES